MKDLYRDETNKDVYAEECCMQPSSSYSNEYVHWLELKLRQYNVIKSLPEPDEIRMKARELDEKDFALWMYELQKGNVL